MFCEFIETKARLIREAVLNESGKAMVKVVGDSMMPMIRSGDCVQVSLEERVNKNDLCLFVNPKNGRLVCHRVTKLGANGITTQGDNETYSVEVRKDFVIGRCSQAPRIRSNCRMEALSEYVGEWIFDKERADHYWIWHPWTRSESVVDLVGLKKVVGDIQRHPCVVEACQLRLRIDKCAFHISRDWIFSATCDVRNQKLQFRLMKHGWGEGANRESVEKVFRRPHHKKNFYKRQLQYLQLCG